MIKIDLEKNIAFIEIGGIPTHIEIQESIDELLRHPDHTDGMDEIWDFSNASMISFNENELRILSSFVKEHLPRLGKRTALLIAEDYDFGIGRMWMAYAEISGAKQERKLFRNMEEAVDWIESFQKVRNENIA
ncbi:hypothetical protein JW960_24990 [candidate division KSB1 bacterium]|nr:hypothetical protein [candidate division KSB1 bacterium]